MADGVDVSMYGLESALLQAPLNPSSPEAQPKQLPMGDCTVLLGRKRPQSPLPLDVSEFSRHICGSSSDTPVVLPRAAEVGERWG